MPVVSADKSDIIGKFASYFFYFRPYSVFYILRKIYRYKNSLFHLFHIIIK